jgi:VanZ family protein
MSLATRLVDHGSWLRDGQLDGPVMECMVPLRYPKFWLMIGWLLLMIAVVASLLPSKQLHVLADFNDKLEHSGIYALLTMWFTGIYPRSRYALIAVSLFVLGLSIEWAQGAMQLGRVSDVTDVLANSAGIAAGLTLALFWSGNWAQRIESWISNR